MNTANGMSTWPYCREARRLRSKAWGSLLDGARELAGLMREAAVFVPDDFTVRSGARRTFRLACTSLQNTP